MPTSIQANCQSIDTVLNNFYKIPDFQREYVWGVKNVEQLLNDIREPIAREDFDTRKADEYFIGSIVVCPTEGAIYQVIDGQQRLITILLILCSIRDFYEQNGFESAVDPVTKNIKDSRIDEFGDTVNEYRLSTQYQDTKKILDQIFDGKRYDENISGAASQNIFNAYSRINEYLVEHFQVDSDSQGTEIKRFVSYLLNKVKVVIVSTQDISSALQLFETVNDRGLSLNSFDLIKNKLFMDTEENEYQKISESWRRLSDRLFNMNERPLRFMRYFIISRYDTRNENLSENSIYGWFSRNSSVILQLQKDIEIPSAFATRLICAAKNYERFLKRGEDFSGNLNFYVQNMMYMGGVAARQHLIVLLAAAELNDLDIFNQISTELEKCMFVYLLVKEKSQTIESNYHQWATQIQKVRNDDSLEDLFIKMKAARTENFERFKQSFLELSMWNIQKYRLKYILAKLSQHIDAKAYPTSNPSLTRYFEDYEFEHIHPQNPSAGAIEEFGGNDVEISTQRLGNLTLLENPINSSLRNAAYSEKREVYENSNVLLTKSLYKKVVVGVNTSVDLVVRELMQFEEWNEESVINRQEMLYGIAEEVWLN